MLPEYRYNLLSTIKFILDKLLQKLKIRTSNISLLSNRKNVFIQLLIAIEDACEFYHISRKEFFDKMEKWENTEKYLWEKSVNLKEFYESWNNEAAIQNTCANIFNQLIWFENYNVCAEYAKKSDFIIDYGCSTGSLSLGLVLDSKIENELLLLDVPNDVSKFIEFRIKKHRLNNVKLDSVFDFSVNKKAELIICIDVLEHLKDSSYIFIKKISPLLAKGGQLILRAPWRGQLTHIDKAADDFYLNGGRKFLAQNFKEVYRFGSQDICAVYKKISE